MESQNTTPQKKRDRIGVILYVAYVLLLLGAVGIVINIAGIQLFYNPDPKIITELTPRNQERKIDPKRGDILDCNGKLLAISCPSYQLYMDCTVLKSS
ncbi:MAG: hypothetical protein IIV12_01430, partial [Bacteroidales bacterium]|nr:hypothetical protein [Bacteroidales bacterium]